MKKLAVRSNRIYLEVDSKTEEHISRELSYVIPAVHRMGFPTYIKTYRIVRKGLLSLPFGRTDLIPEDYEIKDSRLDVPVEWPKFPGSLRSTQQLVCDQFVDSGIVNAPVAWGKTFTGLAIASKLGMRTLIITHTLALKAQWEEQVQELYGITPGRITRGMFDLDSFVVVSNIQTLSKMCDRPEVLKAFGAVILDEMHHVPATTFYTTLDKFPARHRIGLTGTLKRKDKKEVIFKDFFGPTLFRPIAENYMVPEILVINSDITFAQSSGGRTWADRVTDLSNNPAYKHLLVTLSLAQVAKGHTVLMVADRVNLLLQCTELEKGLAVCVVGDTKLNRRDEAHADIKAGRKKILNGTGSIYSEGISINNLSCLILAMQINNEPLLEQLIGRVTRLQEDKPTPVIVDIKLRGSEAQNQFNQRMKYYLSKGYKITVLNT